MDLFELLFVGMIILFSVLEGVMRKRKGSGPTAPGPGPGPGRMESEPEDVGPRPSDREPVKAADMVPDDLWAVLTGEQRPREDVRGEEHEPTDRPPAEPAAEPTSPEGPARWEEAWTPRSEPRWRMDDIEETPAPASLEHRGPEAYSLETFEREPVSLEQPLKSPDVRHRRFHETIDRPPPSRRVRRSRIGRALGRPESVREAVVLSEILGQPKGL